MRRLFALAVLLVHTLLLLWVMSGMPPHLQREAPAPEYFIQWIPLAESVSPSPMLTDTPRNTVSRQPTNMRSIPLVTQPLIESMEIPAAVPEPAPPAQTSAEPKVNWTQEGALAARRAAERLENDRQKTFSPLPKTAKRPCEPKESSMEWNGEQDRRVTWVGPIPVFRVGKRCIVTLGAFACALGEQAEANSHLLDDMRKPDRPRSSVPDPHVCD
jgi:hypothetical protein